MDAIALFSYRNLDDVLKLISETDIAVAEILCMVYAGQIDNDFGSLGRVEIQALSPPLYSCEKLKLMKSEWVPRLLGPSGIA